MFFRKHLLPWTAEDCFETQDLFQAWLQQKLQAFSNLRMICLVLAAASLIVGYVLEQRPIMLLTILPLVLMLLATLALDAMEKRRGGQNKSES